MDASLGVPAMTFVPTDPQIREFMANLNGQNTVIQRARSVPPYPEPEVGDRYLITAGVDKDCILECTVPRRWTDALRILPRLSMLVLDKSTGEYWYYTGLAWTLAQPYFAQMGVLMTSGGGGGGLTAYHDLTLLKSQLSTGFTEGQIVIVQEVGVGSPPITIPLHLQWSPLVDVHGFSTQDEREPIQVVPDDIWGGGTGPKVGCWVETSVGLIVDIGHLLDPRVYCGTGAPGSGIGQDRDLYIDYVDRNPTSPTVPILYKNISGTWTACDPAWGSGSGGGSKVLSGYGTPAGGLGSVGDFYIDGIDTNSTSLHIPILYKKTASTTWVACNPHWDNVGGTNVLLTDQKAFTIYHDEAVASKAPLYLNLGKLVPSYGTIPCFIRGTGSPPVSGTYIFSDDHSDAVVIPSGGMSAVIYCDPTTGNLYHNESPSLDVYAFISSGRAFKVAYTANPSGCVLVYVADVGAGVCRFEADFTGFGSTDRVVSTSSVHAYGQRTA